MDDDFELARESMLDRLEADQRSGPAITARHVAELLNDRFGEFFSETGRLDELEGCIHAAMQFAVENAL